MSALPDRSGRPVYPDTTLEPFLDIPPFPGRRIATFTRLTDPTPAPVSLDHCLALVREARVGGTYWARQPELPAEYILVRSAAGSPLTAGLIEQYPAALTWSPLPSAAHSAAGSITGPCDPWHMLSDARALLCDADDPVRLVAAILGVPVFVTDGAGGASPAAPRETAALLGEALPVDAQFANPFDGTAMNLAEVIHLCGFWRSLIDANRPIAAGVGFAFWKQDSVLPLLWGGGDSAGFFIRASAEKAMGAVAIWRSRAAPEQVERLERMGMPLVEVEDGFLRSRGLGADCVPPLSITVDPLGAYFDPARPSELENILQHGDFEPALLARAARLRETIVAAGLGKYESGEGALDRFDPIKRHILVTGQVEDDRSILTGGFGLTNLDLLMRVRAAAPDAFIIYKPHPDVVAGHRKGHVDEHIGRQFADKVVTNSSISALIAMVDEVHVITSQAGFEALMRHRDVTTYGVPFFAGWGLTRDLGPVPARRTARRSLDELVAAALLMYPRYLDPLSGLPAPAEVVVDRLIAPSTDGAGALVGLRRLQGRWKRRLGGWLGR